MDGLEALADQAMGAWLSEEEGEDMRLEAGEDQRPCHRAQGGQENSCEAGGRSTMYCILIGSLERSAGAESGQEKLGGQALSSELSLKYHGAAINFRRGPEARDKGLHRQKCVGF